MPVLPSSTRFVIVGAGFAGAATAWALARAGLGPGVILEQEAACGAHASGRNAGLLRVTESDPVVRALARRSLECIRRLDAGTQDLVRFTGGLTAAPPGTGRRLAALFDVLRREGVPVALDDVGQATERFALLGALRAEAVLWCPDEGVIDVNALLMRYLRGARDAGFLLYTGHAADRLTVEAGRVTGVRVADREIAADIVIDASGAWAGRLAARRERPASHRDRRGAPLPLEALRRHIFVSGPFAAGWPRDAPWMWMWPHEFYVRPEGEGLLSSPCDETPAEPGTPAVDPAAAECLAVKLTRHAPGLEQLTIRRAWACLRTFAPDRRPLIGADPLLPGLFHVSGLGGFGVTASAAIGELAALAIQARRPDWIDVDEVSPKRFDDHAEAKRRREAGRHACGER